MTRTGRLATVAGVLFLSMTACANEGGTGADAAPITVTGPPVTVTADAENAVTLTAPPVTVTATPKATPPGPSRTPEAPATSSAAPPRDAAGAALTRLPVKGRAPETGYDRAAFGSAWTDDVTAQGGRNGCDTRNDVLRRDLTGIVLKPGSNGCAVLTGTLHDSYSGATVSFVRGARSREVQIDHVVALSNAWQTGAQQLSLDRRRDLANDPLNLVATRGDLNAQKGDGDSATWLPPKKSFRCAYVARQIAVKSRYQLWVTPAERDAMQRILRGCPNQGLPTASTAATP